MSKLNWENAQRPQKRVTNRKISRKDYELIRWVSYYDGSSSFVQKMKNVRQMSPAQLRVVRSIREEENIKWFHEELKRRTTTH